MNRDPAAQTPRQPAVDSVRSRLTRLDPAKRALLERRLQERQPLGGESTVPPVASIPRREANAAPVASFTQRQMWLQEQLAQGAPVQTIGLHFHIQGPLVLDALARALMEVVHRHEPLRTTFKMREGNLTPLLGPVSAAVLTVREAPPLPSPRAAMRTQIAAELSRPFDLEHESPFRAQLVRIAEQEHDLLFTIHHIAFDRWSTAILLRELSSLYQAFVHEHPSPLPELPLRYSDFAAWQNQHFDEVALGPSIDYWRTQLKDVPPWLELPTDRSRPARPSHRCGLAGIELPRPLCVALDALCKSEAVAPFVALLAAYQLLLQRYSGQDDIVVGTPISGRERPEIEGLVGAFINTLPLLTNLSDLADGDLTFRTLLGRVRSVVSEAFRHQSVPFDRIVQEVNPLRRPGTSPLIQTLFSVHPRNVFAFTLEGCAVTQQPLDGETVELDLNFWVTPLPAPTDAGATAGTLAQSMLARIRYSTDLFDAATIERMLSHYRRLLEQVASSPDAPLSRLSLLTDMERQQILLSWNDTAYLLPEPRCVHQLFSAQAARNPDAVALCFEESSVTYRELEARSDELAGKLRALGVTSDGVVGLFLERSIDLVVSMLGTLKAGGAYLPIDLALPQARIAFMLKDAQPAAILTQRRIADRLPASSAPCLFVDAGAPQAVGPSSFLPTAASPAQLAYVLYTSGSTGEPKGVCVEHLALCNLLVAMQKLVEVRASDVVLAATPLSFDIAGLEVWLPLLHGARLVLASESTACDSFALAALLRDSGATLFQATPAGWRSLLDAGWESSDGMLALVGGEALPADLADRLASRTRRAWNVYGPTETTIWSTAKELDSGARPVTIGRPLLNTQVYVLDAARQPVPVGNPGEIYIGGLGLARGYLNRPALTAERFVPSSITEGPSRRIYRTGDRGRLLPNGDIECLGRIDHQVKLRGYRIELGEIESVLRGHPAVREAVVLAREERSGEPFLAAYFVLDTAGSLPERELRRHLQAALPVYMVPSVFTELAALPLSRHGKVDRKALPIPNPAHTQRAVEPIAPRDSIELALLLLWEELLGVRQLGVCHDFFQAGGQSLLAVRLMVRIAERFGRAVPLATFQQCPTVESLARHLRGPSAASNGSPLIRLQPGGSGRPFFCVHPRGGSVLCYQALARQMGSERPFYALSGPSWDDARVPLSRVEDLAADYLAAIRSVHPEGPYLLGGWSFGGLVAFEMAQQLAAAGHEVARLILLDTWRPQGRGPLPDDSGLLFTLAEDLGVQLDRAELQTLSSDAALLRVHTALLQRNMIPAGVALAQLQKGLAIVRAHEEAAQHYRPRPYIGHLVCFVPTEPAVPQGATESSRRSSAQGWRELCLYPVAVHEVPGDHRSMLGAANVEVLAAKLRACLPEGRP